MKNPSLDRLHAAHPVLAEAVRARKEIILTRWENSIRQCLPDADALTLEGLRDGLPQALEELAASLEDHSVLPLRRLLEDSRSHGACRFHQSFNLNELLIEYGVLRGILIEEVLMQLKRPVEPREMAVVDAGLDELMRRGVIAFVHHQKQQIESAANAQSKYLSFLSHDLRGALNGILLMVEVLHRDLGGQSRFAESIDDLEVMRRSILDTVGTMDRFLQAERLRSGKIPLEMASLDLRRLLEELKSEFAHQAAEKGLELRLEFNDNCEVVSDRQLILLVLHNLIGNAIKYTDKGTIHLRLARRIGHCVISVVDEGPGIAADRIETLFDPFVRGETFGQSGAGLGLTIAHQAAEQLGAVLRVESTLGKGTAFYLEIPHTPRQKESSSEAA